MGYVLRFAEKGISYKKVGKERIFMCNNNVMLLGKKNKNKKNCSTHRL